MAGLVNQLKSRFARRTKRRDQSRQVLRQEQVLEALANADDNFAMPVGPTRTVAANGAHCDLANASVQFVDLAVDESFEYGPTFHDMVKGLTLIFDCTI